jgi:flagella basal body P-ring formation protein FlgA
LSRWAIGPAHWPSASRRATGPCLALNRDAANRAVHATRAGSCPFTLLVAVLLVAMLLAPAPAATGASPGEPPAVRVELQSDRIRAADLAGAIPAFQKADPDAVLGYAPIPGAERRVSRGELLRWGQDLGLDLEPVGLPETIILARKMRRLESSEVRELVVEAVAERYAVKPSQVDVELHGFSEPLLPAEALDSAALKRLDRATTLTLRWSNEQGHSGNLSFRATARVRGAYAVARETLAARSDLRAEDFTFEEGFLPGDPGEYAITAQELDGKQLKQNLRQGEALEKRMLAAVPTVERGGLIELQLRSRAVVLRASARAEQAGAAGEVIRCRNLQSGATVRARILDSRQAEVVP